MIIYNVMSVYKHGYWLKSTLVRPMGTRLGHDWFKCFHWEIKSSVMIMLVSSKGNAVKIRSIFKKQAL